jgi:hypothetical protein
MPWLSPLFYREAKFGPLGEKRWKNCDVNTNETFQKNGGSHHSWPQKEWGNFWRVESITIWLVTEKIQRKLAATFNNNKQQQDAKSCAELQTKRMKTSRKAFEDTLLNDPGTDLLTRNSWRMMIMEHACHFRIVRTRSLKVFRKVKLFLSARERRKWTGGEVWLHSCLTSVLDMCDQFHSLTALRSVPIYWEAVWVSASVCTVWRTKTRLAVAGKPATISQPSARRENKYVLVYCT